MTKCGKTFDCEVAAREVGVRCGARRRFVVAARDITERKERERELGRFNAELERRVQDRTRELASSRAFLAAVLDSTADAILTVDEKGIVQSVNGSTTRLLGFEAGELVGRDARELLHESSRAGFLDEMSKLSRRK